MKQRNHLKRQQGEDGFALLIALTLMSVVLMLLVAMTVMVNVETTNSSRQLNQLRAKENARLALMIAIGELQQHAGPDQRVTARAEILGSSIPESNRMWTGVWDTTAPDSSPSWLVSSETTTSSAATTPDNAITIQAGYDPDADGSYTEAYAYAPTQVELIEMNSGRDAIAWWISDEGTKAPISMIEGIDSIIDDLEEESYLDYDTDSLQVIATRHDPIFDFKELFDIQTADADELSKFKRLLNRTHVKLLTDGDSLSERISAELIHSSTLSNAFVLSNPTDGGLKKDLSYLKVLDSTTSTQAELNTLFADTEELITPASIDLVNFRGNPTAFPTDEIIGMQLPYETVQEAEAQTANFMLAPVLTEFQFALGVAADSEGNSLDTNSDSPLYVVYKAYLELWNPYTIPIRIGDESMASEIGYSDLRIVISNLPNFEITNNDLAVTPVQGTLNEISILWSDYSNAKTLRPGMVYLQTLPNDSYLDNKGAIVEALITTPATINGTRRESYTGNFTFDEPLEITIYGVNSEQDEREILKSKITYPDFQVDYDGDNSATRLKRKLSTKAGATGITKASIEQPGYAFGFRFKMLDEQEYPGSITDLSNWQSLYDIRNRSIEVDLADWDISNAWDTAAPLPYDFDSSATGYEPNDFDHTAGFKEDDFFCYNYGGIGRLDRIARFIDVPTSELTDVGIFRSLKFKDYHANSVGSQWGAESNRLYDRYFFSTLPDPDVATWDGSTALANSRITPFDSVPKLSSPDTASALLLSNGFNLNSSSSLAWEKILAGKSFTAYDFEFKYELNDTTYYTESPAWVTPSGMLENVFFNHPQTAIYNLEEIEESESSPRYTFVTRDNTSDYEDAFSIDNTTWLNELQYPTFWQSIRELSDDQVTDLASAIATRIQQFGESNGRPFFSIEELLNEGILEYAIQDVPSINQRKDDIDTIPAYTPSNISSMTLMNTLGPISFVRSDSFRISAIGQIRHPITGEILGTAKCEARLQRTPSPHENTDFGRKFQLIDIKWINTSE
jgi:Tfp pilus assembly protein PilX